MYSTDHGDLGFAISWVISDKSFQSISFTVTKVLKQSFKRLKFVGEVGSRRKSDSAISARKLCHLDVTLPCIFNYAGRTDPRVRYEWVEILLT